MTQRRPTPQERDQQPPPGGPQRTDAPLPDQGESEQDDAARHLQEENAETSLDQPST